MLSRPAFGIRKSKPQKKHEGADDFEGSYFHHDDDDDMDTLSKIRTWRPPMSLMKRSSKPSIDIRKSEDLHRIICIPPLPDTPQSSTTSLCSYDNGTAYVVTTISPRSSPPRRPGRSPLASPLASPETSPQRSPRRSPLLLPEQLEDHQLYQGRRSVSAHSFQDHAQLTPPSSPPQQAVMAPDLPADLSGAFPATPTANSDQAQAVAAPETGAENVNFSDDVQQLIQETDEAFRLRQSFLDAKLPSSTLDKFPKLKDPSPRSLPARRKSQRRSQGSVKSTRSVRSAKSAKSPTKTAVKSPLSSSQARLPSATRPKRAKSKKSRRRPRAPLRQSSLLQLTESARDLFGLRLFHHRIEVDEMLPESTLQEIRMSRAAQWTRHPELGVTHVDKRSASTTSIEPLNLDSVETTASEDVVTPRASVAIQKVEINQEECKTPTAQTWEQGAGSDREQAGTVQVQLQPEQGSSIPLHQPDSPTTKAYNDEDGEEGTLPIMIMADDEPSAQAKMVGTPVPSIITGPLHRRLPSRQLPPLPTIPEIVATGPEGAVLSPTSVPKSPGSACRLNPDDYVFLDSTPFTLTMPGFRHGQIRLAKADLPIGKLAAAVDDTLDWTAFQMAILGGAGDFFSEPTDYSRPSDAELDELDEMVSWFGSFGFSGPGALVGPPEQASPTPVQPWTPVFPRTPTLSPPSAVSTPMSSPRTVISGNRSPGFRRIDPPTPTPSSSEFYLDQKTAELPPASESIANRVFSANEGQQQRLSPPAPIAPRFRRSSCTSSTFGMQPLSPPPAYSPSLSLESRKHVGLAIDSSRRPSVDSLQSLPQSPMMDLVVSHDVEGNEYMVPMGFNLSHDLGDFLTWHAEHVSGSGFGTPTVGGVGNRI